jgi:hypothetical protein
MGKLYIDNNGEVWCNGTFGDAYMMCLKMYNNNIKKINFHTISKNLIPNIKEILSLLGDIPFEYIDYETLNKHKRCVGFIDEGEEGTPFPSWNLPDVSMFELPDVYQVVQLQSGVNSYRTPWKNIGSKIINHLTEKPIVLIGTDNNDYSFLKRKDLIDLRNKTTILESFGVIKKANNFYGPQGLLSFFALSQKVKSVVWVNNKSDEVAVTWRIERIPEWVEYRKYEKNT